MKGKKKGLSPQEQRNIESAIFGIGSALLVAWMLRRPAAGEPPIPPAPSTQYCWQCQQ